MIQSIKVTVTRSDEDTPTVIRQLSAERIKPIHGQYDQTTSDLLHQCLGQQPVSTGQDPSSGGQPRLATDKQVRAIELIAKKQGFDLQRHLRDDLDATNVAALTITEASSLIDHLKGLQPA